VERAACNLRGAAARAPGRRRLDGAVADKNL